MTTRKRIVVSIAPDVDNVRAFLAERTSQEHLPIEWLVLHDADDPDGRWRERCRTIIHGCDGFLGLISQRTSVDPRQHWAIGCAREEQKPLLLMCVPGEEPDPLLQLFGLRSSIWSWPSVRTFVDGVWYSDRLLR